MEHPRAPSSTYSRPRTSLEPGPRTSSLSSSTPRPTFPGSTDPAYLHGQNQARISNRESGEVISNLIFSLSPISNQSERLLEKILPPHEIPAQNPAARAKRRAHTSYNPRSASSGEAPPFLSPLVKEEIVVADKYRDRGELATVDEGSPSNPTSPTAASKRQRLKSLPPPIAVPRRSMSLRATAQAPTIVETQTEMDTSAGDANDGFGSVSVMPGRAHSPSLSSVHSTARRNLIGRSPSRAKSTKNRIKELDAERKKRLSTKNSPRNGNLAGRTNKAQHSPSLSKASSGFSKGGPGLPRTSNVSDDRAASPAKSPFLRQMSGPSSRTPSALGFVEDADLMDANSIVLTDLARGRRPGKPPGIGGGALTVPPRVSSKQSPDGAGDGETRMTAASQAQANAAISKQSKRHDDISKAPIERDEEGTTRRIQELEKKKKERRDAELERIHSEDTKRPPLAEIDPTHATNGIPNGIPSGIPNGVTYGTKRSQSYNSAAKLRTVPDPDNDDDHLAALADALANEPIPQEDLRDGRGTQEQFLSQHQLVSAALAEPRESSTYQTRPFSNVTNYTRPSADVDTYTVADSIDEDVDEYISDPRLSQKIYHQDTGRCVAYSDVGDPNGFVIICCVGMGTSRFVTAFYDELAQTLGLRLITPERPGIGDSEPHIPGEVDTPLAWPDDVRLICQHLNISRFSLLAHSAGAIYALATALRMPANIRGRVHILAPWIPPSQLMAIGQNEEPVPVAELPLIQRILRSIPEAWLEAATRVFNMSSITSSLGKSPYAKRRRNTMPNGEKRPNRGETPALPRNEGDGEEAVLSDTSEADKKERRKSRAPSAVEVKRTFSANDAREDSIPYRPTLDLDLDTLTAEERTAEYDRRLTAMIWQLATSNANPAVDLLVCLERKQEIGFRYEDITKPIVLHHGTKDTRVHVDNVIWLGENMRRCEVRILENEGHGLMANARVMYSVLSEMAQDWRDWNAVVKGKKPE